MTVRSLGDQVPVLAPTAWVSESAYVVGDVHLGEGSSVWPGAVVRGDFAPIRIGARVVIEDNCVVHSGGGLVVGDYVMVGHSVVLHCATVGESCLIGNHATVLDDVEIGDLCLVAAGSLVLPRTVVPDRSFVHGSPATIESISERHLQRLERLNRNPDVGYGMMSRRYAEAGL